MIITRTPFRISFFGGGTDFPDYYRQHGGAVLASTINLGSYISLYRLLPFFSHRFRASYAKSELVMTPADFQHPLIRECFLHLNVTSGMEMSHVSDLPGRTGIGSSSSFTVGLLHALHAFREDPVTPDLLAREAIHVERDRVGDIGGHQDQVVVAHGGFCRVEFLTNGNFSVHHPNIPPERLQALQSSLLLFYLGTSRSAAAILRDQTAQTLRNLSALKEMRAMVPEAENVLLSTHVPLREFGALLHQTWLHKKSLARGISDTTIDTLYAAARKAGAVGGKLLGAGGRGFLLFYAEPEFHPAIRQSLPGLLEVAFCFDPKGSRVIFNQRNQ